MKIVRLVVGIALLCVIAFGSEVNPDHCHDTAAMVSDAVVFQTSCNTISVSQSECWVPRTPTSADVVVFPSGTAAKMPFSWVFATLRAKSIIVQQGAKLELAGGALEASECLVIEGDVAMKSEDKHDNIAGPTSDFASDVSVPNGMDCASVPRGFVPRICGPGRVVVHGSLDVAGKFSSIFARTHIASRGVVRMHKQAIAWNIIENFGSFVSTDRFFLQGTLRNTVSGKATLTTIRVMTFPSLVASGSVATLVDTPSIINYGAMKVQPASEAEFWSYLNGKTIKTVNVGANVNSVDGSGSSQALTKLKLVNEGESAHLILENLHYAFAFDGLDVDLFNHKGTTSWTQDHDFYMGGSTVNVEGTLEADEANVFLNDYLSESGTLRSTKGGWFHFGSAAGVDTKTTVLCDRKKMKPGKKPVAPRSAPTQLTVKPFEPKTSNISCNPDNWDDCPSGLCCGASGFCEFPRCQNADGYGGGPVCCPGNSECGGSSHGPYCGWGIFSWEVDPECMSELEYVDRYEFEIMQTRFPHLSLPKFGKFRYTMRGNSKIEADEAKVSGGVAFTESLEIKGGSLTVAAGSSLRNLMDNGAVPFVGEGSVFVSGRYAAGIKATYDGAVKLVVEPKGRMEVPSYATVWVYANAHIDVKLDSTLQLDGKIFVLKNKQGSNELNINVCGELKGLGGVVGESILTCNKKTA